MSKYRNKLPQLGRSLFITDGGIETTLVFHHGIELPCFAAFDLMRTAEGKATLEAYYRQYAAYANRHKVGLILDTPTWRASSDWGHKLGYSAEALDMINRESVEMLADLRRAYETPQAQMVIGGAIGPRGDGYVAEEIMTPDEAEAYHTPQIQSLADGGADMIAAYTMTNIPEAVGIAWAARKAGLPVAISFTVETDGRLPTGDTLSSAIQAVDVASRAYPVYYMINCAHPSHFDHALTEEHWVQRIRGIRANASKCSHAELNEATELDDGNPPELGSELAALRRRFPHFTVLGGCCGTDHRHIQEIHASCLQAA
jgi:homocysteine S-methyltransferase